MTQAVWVIRRWDEAGFVKRGQNDRTTSMPWVAIPTKHDGKGYLRLASRDPDGSVYGIWILLVAVAAKCPRRGVLADEDGPLTAEDLALKIGRSVDAVSRALELLSSDAVRWICQQAASNLPATCSPTDITDRTEHNSSVRSESGAEGLAVGQQSRVRSAKSQASVFRSITLEVLGDESRLRSWFDWQRKSPDGLSAAFGESEWEICHATARKALAGSKRNPVGWFCKVAGGKR